MFFQLQRCFKLGVALGLVAAGFVVQAAAQTHYYAHNAVLDRYGVIAPWYQQQNGQFDYRVRIAAETIKRYPWVGRDRAVAPAPEYVYDGRWSVDSAGKITVLPERDWDNGDVGDRAAFSMRGMIDYYAYSGDPAGFAAISAIADYLVDHCQTGANHPWPRLLISVPTMGVRYGDCKLGPSNVQSKGNGKMQLDTVAEVGLELVRAYELTGNRRWYDAASHWGDLLADRRNHVPGESPWGRWADNGDKGMNGVQTGGAVMVVMFFDELIRTGYRGQNNSIVIARNAGRKYFRDVLLPAWAIDDTWGRTYWDWEQPDQGENISDFASIYLMQHKDIFPDWKNNVRNILSVFLNHTSVNPDSEGGVFSGAWAYPESSQCCGQSLWYPAMEMAGDFARYGVESHSAWATEVARRSQILATYDALDTGESQDLIHGGGLVSKDWFKIAQPMALVHVLRTMAWMPETMGANRENHIMRTAEVVNRVVYAKGKITYSTFDAPTGCIDVLRLAFRPASITGNGKLLTLRTELDGPGYTVQPLKGGDFIVSLRHDGQTKIVVSGQDPQSTTDDRELRFDTKWRQSAAPGDFRGGTHVTDQAGATLTAVFTGNQVRLVGQVDPSGGLADVSIDGVRQLVTIDCYSPVTLHQQILYYKNGLTNTPHTITIVAQGKHRPPSARSDIYVDAMQSSDATGSSGFGEGGGPTGVQRMIFGYTKPSYIDSHGNTWHPGTEFTVRSGSMSDSVAKTWWTMRQSLLINGIRYMYSSPDVSDTELYRYGVHWGDFTVQTTVGPGTYHVAMKFNETEYSKPNKRGITIYINGRKVMENLDVFATAGGANKAADINFNDIHPENGMIAIRFTGGTIDGAARQAMVQAIEVGPGNGPQAMRPRTIGQR